MLLYRNHKKLKKHTFKIKSKRLNRKSNKVRRQQRGGWPGDEKKLIKRQFLVNAILLRSMYINTGNSLFKDNYETVMKNSIIFMEKTSGIPEDITLDILNKNYNIYKGYYNDLKEYAEQNSDTYIQQRFKKVSDVMKRVEELLTANSRDTNEQLRNILREMDDVTAPNPSVYTIRTQGKHAEQPAYPSLLSRIKGNLQNLISDTFSLIISIGETCLYVDTEPSKGLLKAKFNELVGYFFFITDGVLQSKNYAKENDKYNIHSETSELTGFKYYSGIEEGQGKPITDRFRGLRERILIPSTNPLDFQATVNYINELYRQINTS